MLAQKSQFDWRQHAALRGERVSENPMKLSDARNGNALQSTRRTTRRLHAMQLDVREATHVVPAHRIALSRDRSAALLTVQGFLLHAVTTRKRCVDSKAITTAMLRVSMRYR